MNIHKMAGVLLLLNGVQFLIGLSLFIGLGGRFFGTVSPIVAVSVGLMLISSLMTIAGIYAAGRYQNKSYEESMKNLEALNGKLREQKHDLMNHFQVVYGLMELEEYEEAHAYIRPVFKDIKKLNRALKTAQPAVNALLQAKMEAAEQQEIDFYLEVGTTLKEIPMHPWDLCRILANLMDNAMTALKDSEGEKRLQVTLKESAFAWLFEISDNGPGIPEHLLQTIFSPGFSTKKEEGHGNGLAIVERLVRAAGGTVSAASEDGMTSFLVSLPKGKDENR